MDWIDLAQIGDQWEVVVSAVTNQTQTPWPLVLEGTILTERPPLVDEI
jgi:hypothetical protein